MNCSKNHINNAIEMSYLFAACQIYGCLGAVFGTCSIMTMVVIGYDRYNVIVKGFSGPKIGPGMVSIKAINKKVYLDRILQK